jgi:vancomycin resistance protein VanW
VPFGSGATVFYNYVDLKFDNPTAANYKIQLWLTDTELRGEICTDRLPPLSYHVREEGHRFFLRNGQVYRENLLWRTAHDRATGNQVGCELIEHNVFPVLYQPDSKVVIEPETIR